jgi:NAD(P)-dependent dehydrogenase (short-subunit alcohol dehydrogenase family)
MNQQPIDLQHVIDTVKRWLQKQQKRQQKFLAETLNLKPKPKPFMNQPSAPALIAGGLGLLFAFRFIQRRLPLYSLKGKTVLITGGSRGLGLVLARTVGAQGARVAICGRDVESLRRAEGDLMARGVEVLALACDVTSQAEVQNLVNTVYARFGQIDVLINNAGVIMVGPMEAMTISDYETTMQAHFWGPLYTMNAVLPHMPRNQGRIVNISSIGGHLAVPHLLSYCASKFALAGLSEGARAELAQQGIAVTTVYAGLMRTGSHHHALFKGRHRDEFVWFSVLDTLPLSSVSADAAAREIVRALRHGDSRVIISPQAQLIMLFARFAPKMMTTLLTAMNRFLPQMGGIEKQTATGAESHSELAPSALTTLGEHAAVRHNQLPFPHTPKTPQSPAWSLPPASTTVDESDQRTFAGTRRLAREE